MIIVTELVLIGSFLDQTTFNLPNFSQINFVPIGIAIVVSVFLNFALFAFVIKDKSDTFAIIAEIWKVLKCFITEYLLFRSNMIYPINE